VALLATKSANPSIDRLAIHQSDLLWCVAVNRLFRPKI
jgi:hypothetical protein